MFLWISSEFQQYKAIFFFYIFLAYGGRLEQNNGLTWSGFIIHRLTSPPARNEQPAVQRRCAEQSEGMMSNDATCSDR